MKKKGFLTIILLGILIISCKKTEYILQPPQLQINVTDEQASSVSGSSVSLFSSHEDLENSINVIATSSTNAEGIALFEELEESIYFFYVEKEAQNNLFGIVSHEKALIEGEKKIINVTIK